MAAPADAFETSLTSLSWLQRLDCESGLAVRPLPPALAPCFDGIRLFAHINSDGPWSLSVLVTRGTIGRDGLVMIWICLQAPLQTPTDPPCTALAQRYAQRTIVLPTRNTSQDRPPTAKQLEAAIRKEHQVCQHILPTPRQATASDLHCPSYHRFLLMSTGRFLWNPNHHTTMQR